MSYPVELHASELGRFARRALRAPAKVIARFERSVYVESSAGIACVGGPGLGSGPLNAIVPALAHMPALGSGITVSLRGARIWRPQASPHPDPGRIGYLPMTRARGIFSMAHPGAVALGEWLADGARGKAPHAAASLIGMGPGLTPAGDDLVGGALVALRISGRHACAARVGDWALRLAARRTNRISRAHLACAARGEGGAALHALLDALLAGRGDLSRELRAIDAIGHTSGWDAAAGAALVLDQLRRPRKPRARSPAQASRPGKQAGARPA
jgi:hypothetical protein